VTLTALFQNPLAASETVMRLVSRTSDRNLNTASQYGAARTILSLGLFFSSLYCNPYCNLSSIIFESKFSSPPLQRSPYDKAAV
jgi:hypothetical protein